MSVYAINKKVGYEYTVISTYDAGIVLFGYEVKSIKEGHIKLDGSYVSLRNNELWLIGAHISKYSKSGDLNNYDPQRNRKLLVKKREIAYLQGILAQKGLTLVPLRMYNVHNRIKLEFCVAKGKQKHDKRQTLKERDIKRDIDRAVKSFNH